ncbi:MAG: radical SAM protein [Deltaproteobacteria bacterium]|nr:radical SAM protein [Deltaproteobacteria bacterium]
MSTTIEIQQFKLWDKLQAKRVPVSFDLEITARCNNDCRHCYINLPAGDSAAQASELTAAQILAIASDAAGMGAIWCLLTGGEPLLREDFAELYLGLKRLGLLVSLFTNACLITPAYVDLFQKYPPRDIEVTVYGVTPETYEHITRRPGSYGAFMRGLDLLLSSGLKVRLKAMAMRSNLHEHEAIADFCRARTKDFFRFDPQLHLRFDGDPARNDEIRAERLTPEQIAALECADDERVAALQKCRDTLIRDGSNHGGGNHLFHCGAGEGSFSVSCDGRFRLCSSLWAPGTTYDLRAGTLREAWEQFVPQVRDLRSNSPGYLETCRRCELVDLCLWCPAHAHLETGMMDGATPYFCAVAHARAALLKGKRSKT